MIVVLSFINFLFVFYIYNKLILNKICKIKIYKEIPDAVIPTVSYDNTSAAFDLACSETTTIPAKSFAIVPNNLRISVPQKYNYFMYIQLRSSLGFWKTLVPHAGVIDAGYTGPFGVKIYNLGDEDVIINKGDRYAQVLVLEKIDHRFEILDKEKFEKYEKTQKRGSKGFGSSGI